MQQTLGPRNENEIADVVRAAGVDRRTFEVVGRGTKRGLGRPVEADTVLDVSALAGIVRYEPEELILTARPGTFVAEIEETIAAKNQRIGFEPADWAALYGAPAGLATIGGALSADACGSARVRYGAARDQLLGFRAVNGEGAIYKAGSHVVKNVTGFDVPKLMCGAMGTLGILTEVTLRLAPRSGECLIILIKNVEAEAGLALLRRIWSSPLEATGLAFVPHAAAAAFPELSDSHAGSVLVRLEGAAHPLADKIMALRTLVDDRDIIVTADERSLFSQIGSGQVFASRSGEVWRVFVPPAAAAVCVRALGSMIWLADWAGGVLWIADEAQTDVHAVAAKAGGHAVLMRAAPERRRTTSVFPPETSARAAVTRRVKDAFDPAHLFNPGRMYDGI